MIVGRREGKTTAGARRFWAKNARGWLADDMENPAGNHLSGRCINVAEECAELVTAEPSDDIVDCHQPVEVDVQQCGRGAGSALGSGAEPSTIRDHGQRVMLGC
ncbi:MAG: hypothetical protein ACI8V4_002494 [Ilumatobacter sp.]